MLVILVVWMIMVRPVALGGDTVYVVVSGQSMYPTYESGQLVVGRKQKQYRVGDVVAYGIPKGEVGHGAKVIHRIIEARRDGTYRTQGDNRDFPDMWRPSAKDIDGKIVMEVPYSQHVVPRIRNVWVAAFLAAAYAFLMVKPPRREGSGGPTGSGKAGEPLFHEIPEYRATASLLPRKLR